jgi:hypothetical protein
LTFRRSKRRKLEGSHPESRDAGGITFDKMGFLSKVWLFSCLNRLQNRPKTNLAAGDTTVGSRRPAGGKPVRVKFDGGLLSSDGGVLALREVERRLGVVSDDLPICHPACPPSGEVVHAPNVASARQYF